ncbi:2-(3-amino-3-carboxypropyl)histidine synthase subunit 2 [Epargyreus clarus]|uniref:2-(3-amino-3-carboxypropyl)histidine synthase subunit 2 n=1 Tax=Epargyreus clarus TaxID=520877 RepID=UPI003C2FDCE0
MSNFATDDTICMKREINIANDHTEYKDLIHEFDMLETLRWIVNNKFSKVCLQFPDDLLNVSVRIYEQLQKWTPTDLYILGDTSYASCCVDEVAAMHVKGDAIIHYGRSCFTKTNIPVYIVLPKKHLDIEKTKKAFQENFHSDEHVNLCLFYDEEFEHCKDVLAKCWYELYPRSYMAFVEKEEDSTRRLGRKLRNSEGDYVEMETLENCICVYLGSRCQTSLNFAKCIKASKWYLLDPETSKVDSVEETAWFKRRRYLIEKCKDANVIGILICKLAGDQTKDIISRMKQLCRVNGKKSYIVSVGKPNVAKLANFPEIDIYVMIACPENDLYDNRDFYKPIVYPYELEVALNPNREPYFTNHVTDYDQLLPGKAHYCDISDIKNSMVDMSLITGNIRETKVQCTSEGGMELVEKENWALESIGRNLQERSWKGLEQKLGETEVTAAGEGRSGIPLQYSNEPE